MTKRTTAAGQFKKSQPGVKYTFNPSNRNYTPYHQAYMHTDFFSGNYPLERCSEREFNIGESAKYI